MINFAAISPHAPILLPNVGSEEDRKKVKKTIESLEFLAGKLAEMNPDKIKSSFLLLIRIGGLRCHYIFLLRICMRIARLRTCYARTPAMRTRPCE